MSNANASALSTEGLDSSMYLHCPKMQQKGKPSYICKEEETLPTPFFLANIGSFMYYKGLVFHYGTASLNSGMQKLDFNNTER